MSRSADMVLAQAPSGQPKNIVPQWSLNQGTGMWRRMEQALADIDAGTVRFVVHYASDHGNYGAAW
ncbi:hypothetical protein [Streptomyces sp. NPDC004286]|uniref:hypothetical protein n=1 Tax=Streptomyces sp. NPDC004286 TaxID=3364696 RepID=UPI0036925A4C